VTRSYAGPLPIVPIPAIERVDFRGERVYVGHASLGWRGDLRADSPVTQDGRTFVPVLTEHDWYRSEAEQLEVFAPLFPIDRVWVAVVGDLNLRRSGSPGVRVPAPVSGLSRLTGQRLVYAVADRPDREERDLRAVSEIREGPDRQRTLLVAEEMDWYRWTWTGRTPKAREVPVEALWLE
jgi:hypothetical protein